MNTEQEKLSKACIAKVKYEEVGNDRLGNRQYKTIRAVYDSLNKDGSLNELTHLLAHDDPYVRLWAAAFTLKYHLKNQKKFYLNFHKSKAGHLLSVLK